MSGDRWNQTKIGGINHMKIELLTEINAPIEKCFDLSRSIDLHLESTKQTGEEAIAGRTSGLIELGENRNLAGKAFRHPANSHFKDH